MRPTRWHWMLIGLLVLAPQGARAQCTGMGGGGHDHGRTADTRTDRNQRKARKSAEGLLAEEPGRNALMETILADPVFMRALIARLAAVPAWRSLAVEALSRADSAKARPEEAAVMYRCPMHPEVVAKTPGTCPKCGMKLLRVEVPSAG